jgi:hypothetical protein
VAERHQVPAAVRAEPDVLGGPGPVPDAGEHLRTGQHQLHRPPSRSRRQHRQDDVRPRGLGQQRNLDLGDQFAVGQDVFDVGRVARFEIELGERHPAHPARAQDVHDRVQCDQRHSQVRGVQRDAVLGRPQDRVHPGGPRHCGAAGTRPPLVARFDSRVAEVPAAGALQQVPADRGHVARLDRSAIQQRIADKRQALGQAGSTASSSIVVVAPTRIAAASAVIHFSGS